VPDRMAPFSITQVKTVVGVDGCAGCWVYKRKLSSQGTAFPNSALEFRSSLNLFLTCPRLPHLNYGFYALSRSIHEQG
jgi:hypothetical protein